MVNACLDLCAALASALGRPHDAAVLVGASERLREELGSIRERFERELVERTAREAGAILGPDMLVADLERGRAMSLEDATACARDVTAATTGAELRTASLD